MNNEIINEISENLNIKKEGIEAVLKLLEEGNTVPFIARYRKEATGALDEEQMSDTSYDLGGIHFIMDDNEYLTYGNVTISEVPPQGFVVSVDNPPQRDTGYSECGGSCCDGCSGC